MHSVLDGSAGHRLSLDAYLKDFDREFWAVRAPGFWKLERQQSFKEPGYGSWEAFDNGDWDGSLRLLDEQRDDFREYYRRIAAHGFATRRVRVIEEPMTPYLKWELHVLRLRHQFGGRTRVVRPDQIRSFEKGETLPEIYTLGTDLMYQAIYDERGILEGAVRYADRDLVTRCRNLIETLYAVGEDLDSFFERNADELEPSRKA